MTSKRDQLFEIVQQQWVELHAAGELRGLLPEIVALGVALTNYKQRVDDDIAHKYSEISQAQSVTSALRRRLKDQHAKDTAIHTLELQLREKNLEVKGVHRKNRIMGVELKILRDQTAGTWDADPASRRIRDALIKAQAVFVAMDGVLNCSDLFVAQETLGDQPGHRGASPFVLKAAEIDFDEGLSPAVDALMALAVPDEKQQPVSTKNASVRCEHGDSKWLCVKCLGAPDYAPEPPNQLKPVPCKANQYKAGIQNPPCAQGEMWMCEVCSPMPF